MAKLPRASSCFLSSPSRDATAVRCSSILPRLDGEKRERSRVEHIAGITGPRDRCKADYKGVKSIKITMYFSSRCCALGNVAGNETASRTERKDEEVECDAK